MLVGVLYLYPAVDVRGLFVDGTEDSAGVAIEHILCFCVSYTVYNSARNALDIYVGVGFYLSAHHHEACAHKCFAGYFGFGVLGKELVKYGV